MASQLISRTQLKELRAKGLGGQWKAWLTHRRKPRYSNRCDVAGVPIQFKLSFDEFCAVWGDQFHKRGTKLGELCLSRYDDLGHYEVGNVFIQPQASNTQQAQLRRMANPTDAMLEHCSLGGIKSSSTYMQCTCGHLGKMPSVFRHINKCGKVG